MWAPAGVAEARGGARTEQAAAEVRMAARAWLKTGCRLDFRAALLPESERA